MSEVKRYIISGLHPHMYENKDGFMVYYEDYARLKAEVERLRKAGDAMASLIKYEPGVNTFDPFPQVVKKWNAANEGKPSV